MLKLATGEGLSVMMTVLEVTLNRHSLVYKIRRYSLFAITLLGRKFLFVPAFLKISKSILPSLFKSSNLKNV